MSGNSETGTPRHVTNRQHISNQLPATHLPPTNDKPRITSRRRTQLRAQVIGHIVLIALGITFFMPLAWLISTSLKADTQIFVWPPRLWPDPIMWSNYPKALQYIDFWMYTRNTLYVTGLNVLGVVFSSALVAYGFSKIAWRGRDVVFVLVLSTLMLPFQVTMIPVFVLFKSLGWVGSFKPLIIPAFFGNAFGIFMLRQFFMTIPPELSDAARIDGCSEFGIFTRIVMPLSKAALSTLGVFVFMWTWRDFLGPLIYLQNEQQYTLALGLRHFLTQHGAEWAMLMAASTVVSLPMIVIFFLAQRTFIQGITLTGIKG